ncbi:unnamed protein product [Clonostachys rosea]|uniref:Uncharacterized protein n=1 Tax=Bionectria ochroleuca TaxID=29856 RepID=A0ABY6UMR0_BIOOC|nr:unnamed protein product [Clonostachys rosea]
MSCLGDCFRRLKERIFGGSFSLPWAPSGTSPQFEKRREEWQKNCTQPSILRDFTEYLLHGTPLFEPTFMPWEETVLLQNFTRHANSYHRFDQDSFVSYLLTQIPGEEKFKATLVKAVPALWSLMVYFALWPFNATMEYPARGLAFPDFIRAIAFLCGRHSTMFKTWIDRDGVFNRKTDQPMLEYIFRALATSKAQASSSLPGQPAQLFSQRDILDVLNVSQPILNCRTESLNRNQLRPLASQLSSTPPELSHLSIRGNMLMPILELSSLLLQQVAKFDETSWPAALKDRISTAQKKLRHSEQVSYELYRLWLDHSTSEWNKASLGVPTLYDSLAILFNTFVNPGSLTTGKTQHWNTGKEKTLLILSLRNPDMSHS